MIKISKNSIYDQRKRLCLWFDCRNQRKEKEGRVKGQGLEQAKLDVSCKTRANLFNWRGQFTPELIEYLLDCYACPGAVVAYPFAGSGTVLLESARRQLDAYGFEINPAAYTMSKFYGL